MFENEVKFRFTMRNFVFVALAGMIPRVLFPLCLLTAAAWLTGCEHSTAVIKPDPITFSSNSEFAHLEVGGLTILSQGDSLVNFDLIPNISVTNTTDSTLHLFAVWNIDTVSTNRLYTLPQPSDTIDLGMVPSQGTTEVDSIILISLPMSVANSILYYDLTICDGDPTLQNPLSVWGYGASAPFDSVPFPNRWRGIIYTTEASPNPIGIIDGPDDSDWQATPIFTPNPAYPNPAITATSLGISFPAQLDSVKCQLFITPHHVLQTIADGTYGIGTYVFQTNLSALSPGSYRALWSGYKNGAAVSSHGDIMVPLP